MNRTLGAISEPQGAERRRTPRVSIIARVHGHILGLNLPTTLLDLSTGGFFMQSPVAFPVGAIEQFRFTVDQVDVVLRARVVRVMTASRSDGLVFMTGLEFVESDDSQRAAIERILVEANP